MEKQVARALQNKIVEVERKYSNVDRANNFNKESFKHLKTTVLSAHAAAVEYKKSTGKIGIAFFYYIQTNGKGYWNYFFPKESHLTGMMMFPFMKTKVENHNYPINFN